MLLHPANQQIAQEEIDRVVGSDRLPSFSDRPNLPYVEALWKEVLRWNTIGAMGLPHASTEDDTVVVKTSSGEETYTIPKGSMLMPGVWWFLRDPSRYKDPDTFEPKRFLGEHPETDPATVTFGFGRRACPGRMLADATAWLTMAQTLAVFDIRKKRDAMGREVEVVADGLPGLAMHPYPFEDKMDVVVRKGRRPLLERLEKEETWGVGEASGGKEDWELLKDLEVSVESY